MHNTYSPENGAFVIYGSFYIHDGPDNIITEAGRWGAAGCVEVCGTSGFDKLKQYIAELSGYKGSDVENHMITLVKAKKLYLILEGTTKPTLQKYNIR